MLQNFRHIKLKDVLFVDIETRSQVEKLDEESQLYSLVDYTYSRKKDFEDYSDLQEMYDKNAALSPELGAICVISVGFLAGGKLRVASFSGEDEGVLLKEFAGFLNSLKAFKAVCGFASNMFDIPFILIRLLSHGIMNIPAILDESHKKPWEKVNIDLKDMIRLGRYSAPSLLGLATTLGVDSPKDGIIGAEVSAAFYKGRLEEITAYCERDVLCTANCLLVLLGEEQVEMEVVQITQSFEDTDYPSMIEGLLEGQDIPMTAFSKEVLNLGDSDSVDKFIDMLLAARA